jgi:hypothetical protein
MAAMITQQKLSTIATASAMTACGSNLPSKPTNLPKLKKNKAMLLSGMGSRPILRYKIIDTSYHP